MQFPEHRLAPEPTRAVLDRLRWEDQEQRDQNVPVEERTRNVTAPTGRFLYSLVRSIQPDLIFEIGSSTGYSTAWMALAAREYGGRVVGSEILPDRAVLANQNLKEAGLDAVAFVETGDGSDIALHYENIAMVFLDAEKDEYSSHFVNVIERVGPSGLVLTDNVTSHDCEDLLEMIRKRGDCVTQTIPFERGLEYTVKLY